jgi:fluoride exporter
MMAYLWIALGGALGSVARFASTEWVQARWPAAFPWGTLLVNVLGSLIIGMLAAMTESGRWPLPLVTRQFLMIGVLGGYTTFSSFSLQTLLLLRSGAALIAGLNVLASVALCLLAAWCGFALMSVLNRV